MLLTAASLIVIVKPHLPCRYQQSSPIALKLVRVSEHRVHVATYAGLDLRCATGEELQDLELVLRALIGLCVHQWELPGGAHSVREALNALLESAASAGGSKRTST